MRLPLLVTTLPDPERCRFARYRIVEGQLRARGISLRLLKRVFRSLMSGRYHPEFDHIVAGLTVVAGEMIQRQLVRRVLAPGVRGIPVSPPRPRECLFNLISPKAKRMEKIEMMRTLQVMIDQALARFKEEAGFPQQSPQAWCFSITDAVIEAAKSEACREYLEMNARSSPHILSGDLPHFLEILSARFPEEFQSLSEALHSSSTRDHLAATSLTGEGGALNVTVVNSAGCRLTVRSRRFVQLMCNPGHPVQLGEIPDPRRYREPEVIFNHVRKGVVHGLFSKRHGSIEVICVDPEMKGANALLDRSNIAIDVDYGLCLALVLDRLHRDEERVSRLMQELSTKAVDEGHRQLFTLK